MILIPAGRAKDTKEDTKFEESEDTKKETPVTTKNSRVIEDQIIVRVNGRNILASDLDVPRIGKAGGKYTRHEAIMDELFCQRAGELHMLPSAADIERQFVAFKIQNNLTDMSEAEFDRELKESGFSTAMYKYQLGRLIAVENVKRAEVSEKSLIASQDVEAYYNTHKKDPEAFTKEKYHLKTCTMQKSEEPTNKQDLLNNKKISWDDLDWIEKKDLRPELQFVTDMKKGEISDPITKDGMLEYVLLFDKQERRLKTLDERYAEIEQKLQEQKREVLWKNFEKTIKEKAVIVNLA